MEEVRHGVDVVAQVNLQRRDRLAIGVGICVGAVALAKRTERLTGYVVLPTILRDLRHVCDLSEC